MTDDQFHAHRTTLANAFAAAGAELLGHMSAAGALAQIPNTQQYAVAGDPAAIRAQLDTVDPQRRMRKGDRPDEELYWGAEAGQRRRWSILITEGGKGVVADYGHRFPGASAELERVDVVEAAAPASTVLTDERISAGARWLSNHQADACGIDREDNWKLYGGSIIEEFREACGAAFGIPVAAQAGQVAVPETIHCREFHELAMDYRAALVFGAHQAYAAMVAYIDARLGAQASTPDGRQEGGAA